MKNLSLIAVALCLSLFSFAQTGASGGYEPNEVIIMVERGVNPAAITGTIARATGGAMQLNVKQVLSERAGIYLIENTAGGIDEQVLARQLHLTTGVKAAQLNYHVSMRETIPNDPQFAQQWHHLNTGQTGGTVGADVRTTEAWDITTGGQTSHNDDIVVCIIEGANMNHPDLTANHWVNTAEIPGNGIDDDGNGYVDDYNGWNPSQNNDNVLSGNHGTSVAGMIGAKGDNNLGVAGANWDVKMMVVTVGALSTANVLASYGYPYEMRALYNQTNGAQGAFVVATNASWGIDNADPSNFAVWCNFYDIMGEEGILSCGATANNNVNIDVNGDMPTGCLSPYMVAVTATNHNDVRTFSGYGVNSINVAAPGESVRTTSGTNTYTTTSGTSFASPLTAGVIGLIYSAPCASFMNLVKADPQAGADLVRQYLYDGVDVIPNLINEVSTGGRINAFNSLNLLLDNCFDNPCQPITNATANVDCNAGGFSITLNIQNNEVIGQYNVLASVNGGNPTTVVSNQPQGNYTFGSYSFGDSVSLTVEFIGNPDCNVSVNNISAQNVTLGCTDSTACNYNVDATCDDGSCATEAGWFVDADGDGYGDENDLDPYCENPCDGTIVVTINSTGWMDETTWTLSDNSNTVILSGGPYGNGGTFSSNVQSNNGPFTFFIETEGQFGDNTPTWTVATGVGLVLGTGTRPGGTTFTSGALSCSYINNNLDCDDSNANINPDVPGSCENIPEPCVEPTVRVIAPAPQAGDLVYSTSFESGWGASLLDVAISAPAVLVEDGAAGNLGCNAATNGNALDGNIAVVFRGTCQFSAKAINAQNAGAQALVIINNDAGGVAVMGPGDFGAQITIPVVMITQADGQALLGELSAGNVVMFIGNDCAEDCAGVAGGSAYLDNCGVCVGGTTGITPVNGCTDVNACNYNPNATCDDGSCLALDECGNCGGSAIAGCVDASACNYNSNASCDDGSCLYFDACGNCGGSATAGCIDPMACNYDALAACDNGSCEYESCAECWGDFNGDGMRDINDLLVLIAEFGCTQNCTADLDDNGMVNGNDVLLFLGVFATPCN